MSRAIRTELLKQRTTRTFVAGIAAAPVIGALVTVAAFGAAGSQGNEPLGTDSLVQAIGAPSVVVTVVALILGVLGMTGEYRHQTITTTFLACPRRRDVVLAKVAAHALTGVLMGAMSVVAAAAVAIPWLRSADVDVLVDGRALGVAGAVVLAGALNGALGVSLGAVIRNQTAAAAVVLVWLLVVEGALGDLFPGAGFTDWLPGAAGRAIVHSGSSDGALTAAVGAAVLALQAAALALAGTRLTLRRDIT